MVKFRRDLNIKTLQHQIDKIKFRLTNKFPSANVGDTVGITMMGIETKEIFPFS